MKESTLHYNYHTTVCEKYDLTLKEALLVVKTEEEKAKRKKRAIIITGNNKEKKSFFDAFASRNLSPNFTWIHFCPQEVLEFDEENQEGKFYVLTMTACS